MNPMLIIALPSMGCFSHWADKLEGQNHHCRGRFIPTFGSYCINVAYEYDFRCPGVQSSAMGLNRLLVRLVAVTDTTAEKKKVFDLNCIVLAEKVS